jgi:coproporphyrinogen III oxidase-like Fe-S oxidoreductase
VDLDRIARLSGLPVDMLVDRDAVARIAGHGMIRQDGQRLRVDPAGMLLLDAILPEIVAV